jgi:hypothetical protein
MRPFVTSRLTSSAAIMAMFVNAFRVSPQTSASGIGRVHSAQISVDHSNSPHAESFIAVDQHDPRHLIATSIVVINGQTHAYPYVSFDGGITWARGKFLGDSSMTAGGDPIVYMGPNGDAFFCTLAKIKGVSRTPIARSTDGGRTWRMTVALPNTDRQWMAIDTTRGPFDGRTYFTGSAQHGGREGEYAVSSFLARSDDGGKSFPMRSVVSVDAEQRPIHAIPHEPLVTTNGVLVLALQGGITREVYEQWRRDSLNVRGLGLITSDDGGQSFGIGRYAPELRLMLTGSPERRFRDLTAGGNVRVTIDASESKYGNRIYFAASNYDSTVDRYVVQVWYTSDMGKTWQTSIASDAPRGDVANAAIAVNRDGVVGVIWNDRRDDPQGKCWRLYASISLDGGENFLPAQRLSDAPTCVNEPKNWTTFGTAFNSDQTGEYLAHFQTGATVPARFPMGGDTQGLGADATGKFHAAWINGQTGVMQLWHTSFSVDPARTASLRTNPSDTTRHAWVDGMEDVTHDVRFRVIDTKLDFATHTYAMTVVIENRSGRPLRGPLRATMRQFLYNRENGMSLKNLAASNADNQLPAVGAFWDFSVNGGRLAPGQLTATRVLRFTFQGGIPDIPDGYLTPGFRVFGRSTR